MGKDYSAVAQTLRSRGVLTDHDWNRFDFSNVQPHDEAEVKRLLQIVEGKASMVLEIAQQISASRFAEEHLGAAPAINPTTGMPYKLNPMRPLSSMTCGGHRIVALKDEEGRLRIAVYGDWDRYKMNHAVDGAVLVIWPKYSIAPDPYK